LAPVVVYFFTINGRDYIMTVNREHALALADLIETLPRVDNSHGKIHGFNLNYETFECGAPACLAGWSAWEQRGHPETIRFDDTFLEDARKYLGISEDIGGKLFYPFGQGIDFGAVTPEDAALTLRKLVETGEVDWSHAPHHEE
jgi:hypothetical protein